MQLEIVTKEDLHAFRVQLISDIKELLRASQPIKEKSWLKNSDVKKLLNISKVGGVHYYRYEDIEGLLKNGFEK
jgi:hypothetical protein